MEFTLEQLNDFLGKAALATYAGGSEKIDPLTPGFVSRFPGFKELEYKEGDFYYRDSYAGFFRSAGEEVIFHKRKPVWVQHYYGGVESKYLDNEKFARETFIFLKKALSHGEKSAAFQPRGPMELVDGDWKYNCDWKGDISDFNGSEGIFYKNELVFTHKFFGGLLKWAEK
jgi:hypothetical protein